VSYNSEQQKNRLVLKKSISTNGIEEE